LTIVDTFLADFFKSQNKFPPKFESVLQIFYSLLTEHEETKSHLGLCYSEDALRLFGGFLTLRFICPAVVSPQKYKLVKSEVPTNSIRTLVLASKIVQGISNQVEFDNEKEQYMIPANEFVFHNTPRMMHFLRDLMSDDRQITPNPNKSLWSLRSKSKVDKHKITDVEKNSFYH